MHGRLGVLVAVSSTRSPHVRCSLFVLKPFSYTIWIAIVVMWIVSGLAIGLIENKLPVHSEDEPAPYEIHEGIIRRNINMVFHLAACCVIAFFNGTDLWASTGAKTRMGKACEHTAHYTLGRQSLRARVFPSYMPCACTASLTSSDVRAQWSCASR